MKAPALKWLVFAGMVLLLAGFAVTETTTAEPDSVDDRVQALLQKMRNRWRDMNVPEQDGRAMFDIILENNYTKALEIGTSTGHSGIWIAWALSKTGGRLITIEIDDGRHREAVGNFKEAGLDAYIDARLADAHELVGELPGPFDFVFIDADKEWYSNYAKAVIPKLEAGGCIAAHNVREPRAEFRRRGRQGGTDEYFEYMKSLPGFETFIDPQSRGDLAVSYKKPNQEQPAENTTAKDHESSWMVESVQAAAHHVFARPALRSQSFWRANR